MNQRISFIGAGNMAEALIRGLIRAKIFPAASITAADPREERRTHHAGRFSIAAVADNREAIARGDIVVLAVKPQALPAVAGDLGALRETQLLISILAGVTTGILEEIIAKPVPVVRAMPNTPALVQAGVTAICAGKHAREEHLLQAETILGAVGKVVRIPEKLMNAVTAVSGSGPAYFYLFVESLAAAARDLGLEKEAAEFLARETLIGAARLLAETGDHPASLRGQVTSPGGTTAAALEVLERGELRALLAEAVEAACRRGEELGERLKGISGRPRTQ